MNENLFFTLILKVVVSVVGRLFSLESLIVFINDDITDVGLIKKNWLISPFLSFFLFLCYPSWKLTSYFKDFFLGINFSTKVVK